MKKCGVLQLGLQLGVLSDNITCNWMYFYNMNVIQQVTKVAAQFTIYEIVYVCKSCNYVATLNLIIATIMSLHCNYYVTT
jgi:hypothetical protein